MVRSYPSCFGSLMNDGEMHNYNKYNYDKGGYGPLTFSPLYRPVPPALDSPFYRPLAPALDSHSQRPQTASTTTAIADSHHPTPFESVTYT